MERASGSSGTSSATNSTTTGTNTTVNASAIPIPDTDETVKQYRQGIVEFE